MTSSVTLNIACLTQTHSHERTLSGRNAWAMRELILAGERGCTPIDNPAPAWAAYVQNLRGMGYGIETITEPHGGPFKGHHGRYVLRDEITIKEWREHDDAA